MLADFQALVERMTRADASEIADGDLSEAIRAALARYSEDRPRTDVFDVTAPGGCFLSLPSGWDENYSELRLAEYPIESNPLSLIPLRALSLEQTPTGWRWRLLDREIDQGESVRLVFTAPHQVTDTVETLLPQHREGVAAWAAAHLLDQLSALKAGQIDASIGAAEVNRATPSDQYAARARDLRKRYYLATGVDPNRVPPACAVADASSTSRMLRGPHLGGGPL